MYMTGIFDFSRTIYGIQFLIPMFLLELLPKKHNDKLLVIVNYSNSS
jgi:hypothetical protein